MIKLQRKNNDVEWRLNKNVMLLKNGRRYWFNANIWNIHKISILATVIIVNRLQECVKERETPIKQQWKEGYIRRNAIFYLNSKKC